MKVVWKLNGAGFVNAAVALWLFVVTSAAYSYDFSEKQQEGVQRLFEAAERDRVGYEIVESLTTEVGARLAGSEAEKRARRWAVKKFKSLGIDRVRIETFQVPGWTRGLEKAEILSPYPQQLTVTALGGSQATPQEGVEGTVVLFPSLKALQAVKDGGLKGKIVFVDEAMARTQDGSGYIAAVSKRGQTAFEAHRVGAVAALIRSVGTSHHRFAHTGQMKRVTDKNIGESVPTAALSAPDADQLARIAERGKKIKLRLTLTPKHMPASESGNVIAEIKGRQNPEEIVLVGAHLDSWDLGTGAVDDGAGVGIVMAAAHLIKKTFKKAPKRTIRIVLFGSEEVGLVGAQEYTQKHSSEIAQHIIAAESDFGADVIWRFSSANVAQDFLPNMKALQSELAPLKIFAGDNKGQGGPDVKFLREAGVPIADLRQNGVDYFDLHHTADDTFDKVELDKLRQNIAAYAAFVYLVADSDIVFR